jgi:hypothetical protein
MNSSKTKTTNQNTNIIEEIPSHELYANLVGIPNSYTEVVSQSFQAIKDSPAVGINLIPPPPPSNVLAKEEHNHSEFGKVYKRASEGFIEPSKLTLNSSNKGYQMLEKMGWKESEGGLGKERQGRLIPLTPSLKLDQKGLGCSKTIILPKKKTYIQPPPPPPCQKRIRQRMQEEAQEMKRIRVMLRSDLSDEYLSYL